jgi:hypothetical protein
MLYHLSFPARDPERVASVLAELLDATVVACPSPPFPAGSKFVCCGDERGTMAEIVPAGATYVPGPDATIVARTGGPVLDATAVHGMFLAAVPREHIEAVAAREGWPCGVVDTGLFQVISLWLEGHQLVEFTTPALLPDYLATYGADGIDTLDAKMRAIESQLTTMLEDAAR